MVEEVHQGLYPFWARHAVVFSQPIVSLGGVPLTGVQQELFENRVPSKITSKYGFPMTKTVQSFTLGQGSRWG